MGNFLSGFLLEGEVATPDYQVVINELTGTFTSTALADILKFSVGAVAGLVLFWWAVRKVSRIFIRAFTKGKFKL